MSPRSRHISKIAAHVAQHLHTPDILFVQEIQDDSGSRNDGTVLANRTLKALADAIKKASGGVQYDFVNVEPEDNKDGGQPGGNIRVAYLCVQVPSFSDVALTLRVLVGDQRRCRSLQELSEMLPHLRRLSSTIMVTSSSRER